MTEFVFTEVQHFRKRWAWLMVLAINGLFLYAIVQQVIFRKPFGNTPVTDTQLILLELGPLLLLLFIASIRLKTTFNDRGISYRYYPFQFKTTFIDWRELGDAYLRQYNSFYEYGGWGIRPGNQKAGRALNSSQSCNIGLQLRFKDGSLLLIGTKDPEKIKPFADHAISSGKINRNI